MALGDEGRAAELATLGRAYEIARAASRYTVHELEPPSFEGDWAHLLAPYGTGAVRGWYPLLFVMADAEAAPAGVRELFAIEPVDGWGHRWRITTGTVARGRPDGPEAAADLARGLQSSLFRWESPDLSLGDWFRLEIVSAGRDGVHGTDDDLALVAWIKAGHTFRISAPRRELRETLERAYLQGPVYFRLSGNRWDLIDTRILGEFRLDLLR